MTVEIEEQNVLASGETKGARRVSTAFMSRGFHSLRVRNFRLFIIGQVISLSGTWMQTTAQAWLVLQMSNSPFALGFVTTLQFMPVMLLSLYGGVLADRLPKRHTLLVTQALLLTQASIFGLLVGTNLIQLWHIYILAVIQGCVQAIDTPVRQAFVAEMVGRDELTNAIALNSMTFNGARIIGPSLAGFVIAKFGVAPALYFNAFSFVAVLIALFLMDEKALFKAVVVPQGSAWLRLKEGLSYTRNTPSVLVIIIILAAIGTFGYNFTTVLPLIATYILHTDAEGFGALSSFLGIGSLLAALSTAYVKEVRMRRLLIGATAFSILLALTAITPVFAISAILLATLGAAAILFSTSANTLLQLTVPDHLRGRVMSLHVLLVMGSTPIGAFLIGLLSEHLGVPAAILTCAALCMLGVITGIFYRRRHPQPLQTLDTAAQHI
jgi:MFS family permease